MADENDITELVAKLSAAFPNWTPNEYTVEIYFEDLRDVPSDLLFAAAAKSRTEPGRKFAPSTGELRGAVADIRRTVAGVPTSYQAWQEVMQAMIDVGSYRQPEFTHSAVEQAVRAMGWRNLCLSENQVADRARFIQAYEQLATRAEAEAMELPQVRGYIEAQNGKQLPAPSEMIGKLARKLGTGADR